MGLSTKTLQSSWKRAAGPGGSTGGSWSWGRRWADPQQVCVLVLIEPVALITLPLRFLH